MKIGIIGCDIIGLGFALLCEQAGFTVLISDEDKNFIFNLNQKICITNEPLIQSLLLNSKKLTGTLDVIEVIKNSDVIFTFIETPPSIENDYDTSKIFNLTKNFFTASSLDIPLYGKKFIICSTTNPGDVEQIQKRLSMFNIMVGYNPTIVSVGKIIDEYQNSNIIIIIGSEYDEIIQDLTIIYNKIKKSQINIYSLSFKSSEITKIAIDSFLTTKLSFSNMIGDLMDKMGVQDEINIVLNAIGGDKRIGKEYLKYDFGIMESSLPKSNRLLVKYLNDLELKNSLPLSVENDNKEHIQFLKEKYVKLNPDKNVPFILDSIFVDSDFNELNESPQMKLCIELLNEGYFVYIYTKNNSPNNLLLSNEYENRLKFFKPGSNPQAFKIKL
jgi:nucleotide sugar dehydrogenase